MATQPQSDRGHHITDALMHEFKLIGTAGRDVVFITDGGHRYVMLEVQTTEVETQVLLLEEGK